jgi:hypothetical protein
MIQTPNPNRFSSSLILAALLLFFPLSSCGGGDGTSDWDSRPASQTPTQAATPSQTPTQTAIQQAASTLCQKVEQCGLISSGEMGMCEQELAKVVSMLPDPDHFMACIKQQSCDTLANESTLQPAIDGCLNIDMSSVKCNSDQKTIHACTNNGVCKDIVCSEVCSEGFDGASYMYCAYASEKGHDVCWCQL